MTEQMEKAIHKIDKESEKGTEHERLVAQKVIEAIVDEASAENVLKQGKSLKGCMAYITGQAKRKAKGNCAMVEGTQVYAWALDYYGLRAVPRLTLSRAECNSRERDALDVDFLDLI